MAQNLPCAPLEALEELRRRVLADPAVWRPLSEITEHQAFIDALAEHARRWQLPVDEAAIAEALADARRQSRQHWV
jgi:hypothetical protein